MRSGDFWVVVFVPVRAFCPGSKLLPISLASAVIGTDIEIGRPPSDGDGAWAVDALGVDVTGAGAAGLTAGAGAGAGAGAFGTVVVGVVIFGTVTVVGVVDAPIGPMPVNTVAAAKTRPPAATAAEEKRFRLKCPAPSVYGLHRPALSPRLSELIPTRRNSETARNFAPSLKNL